MSASGETENNTGLVRTFKLTAMITKANGKKDNNKARAYITMPMAIVMKASGKTEIKRVAAPTISQTVTDTTAAF